MKKDFVEVFPRSRAEWRTWLLEHHATTKRVWVMIAKKGSNSSSLTVEEAVEEALCFGWIDSTANKVDDEKFKLTMSQRKPGSRWSGINKARVKKLIKEKLMTPAGLKCINDAKKSGAWTALDSIERLEVPVDLKKALKKNTRAFKNFDAFPPSAKRVILLWIDSAKKPETRVARIEKTVSLASENIRSNQWTPKK